ncbi:YifB family Mg chelatase-like AAA ATPase [Coxiella burnetii]|uniref:YifB family Mg chelatase-like AAA ATPase n=1 Tax=Coxiella burnetii TaxID=777 RepID=UPI0005FBC3A2|nr:YifB family Mg chelatase-like AAA ATPase [Coxiella burnetii]KJY14153.1 magnesium chelatase [Coxiella burnetii]
MSLAIVHSRGSAGIDAPPVTVEVHISNGMPVFSIVGLPETAVKESRHRVRSAIINSQLEFPVRRITVNLAPTDLPKEGGRFDLAIALGILAASQQIPSDPLNDYEFAGELALSGDLRPICGALPFAIATAKAGRKLIIASANAQEAALSVRGEISTAQHLVGVCAHLRGEQVLPAEISTDARLSRNFHDLKEVKGQTRGKRALEIAAAGGHNLLFIGPPGTGKTMLAMRLPGILPEMTVDEALEVATVYSLRRKGVDRRQWRQRPFRAPHHSTSAVAMVGGSTPPQPGEITLAHHGILFLDELPEFSRAVLESLREPLEEKAITISRASYQVQFPANFQLVTAMNPCPCGYLGDPKGRCRCTSEQVERYRSRISGPLLDRIDMHVEIPPLSPDLLFNRAEDAESSKTVNQRVCETRARQVERQQKPNAWMSTDDLCTHCRLDSNDERFIQSAISRLALSARGYHRFLKVARTIADLAQSPNIERPHLAEALGYRMLDRKR